MLDRITASLPSLAPAEQRVGRLVLQDARAFARLPVRELAERAHVSKPTVVNCLSASSWFMQILVGQSGRPTGGIPTPECMRPPP